MNAFANTLFSILLSWVKSLVQACWDLVSGGGASGFFVWLGDHWLPLAVVLCLCGVVVDLLIWLIRWRPDLVWRTKLRHFSNRLRGREMRSSEQRMFQQGYQDGPEMQEAYGFYPEAWQPEETQMEPAASVWWDAEHQDEAQAEAAWQPSYQAPVYEEPVYAAPAQEAAPRRRRSDRYQKTDKNAHFSRLRDKLWENSNEEEAMLDGLPPIVDKDQAFYAPVYPKREHTES